MIPALPTRLAALAASPYSSLVARAGASGAEVFAFHVGDTWMEPAVCARMESLPVAEFPGMHAYTDVRGWGPLRAAIAAREPGGASADEILVTAGATSGLSCAAAALLSPGDEVLVLAPYWPLLAGMVRAAHGVPVEVPFHVPRVAAAEVSAVLDRYASDRTRALYVNTPHNPTGQVLPRETLVALAEWARARGVWIWSDEVYARLCWGGRHVSMRPLAPERTLAVHSFSKAFGMAGNRCGWLVGPPAVLAEIAKVTVHTVYGAPTASQIAGLRALTEAEAWSAEVREQYRHTAQACAGILDLPPPEGSTFLFFDVARHLDVRGLVGLLERAADAGILLAPGPSFGPYPTHVRLCYTACPPEKTRRGVDRLATVLRASS